MKIVVINYRDHLSIHSGVIVFASENTLMKKKKTPKCILEIKQDKKRHLKPLLNSF